MLKSLPNHRVDILAQIEGNTPVAIETEFMPALTVEADAVSRINKVIRATGLKIEHAIAVRIPSNLRGTNQRLLAAEIEQTTFHYCVHSASRDDTTTRWPRGGWMEGSVDDLARCLEIVSMSDSLISRGTESLEDGVSEAANHLSTAPAAAQVRVAALLHQTPGEQTNRMAAAIIANAMIFHVRLESVSELRTLDALAGESGLMKPDVTRCWQWIIKNVNYWAIFDIATRIAREIPTLQANRIFNCLHHTAAALVAMGIAGLNDMSGRMFQRLIADRKFLATYYTLPTSAALMAEMAVGRLNVDWSDSSALTSVRVADFACGTGALIGSVYGTMLSKYRRTGADDALLHATMMENALYALDIMPAATHLAASTLANAHPGIAFNDSKVVTIPYGIDEDGFANIGSLDLIAAEYTRSLSARDKRPVSLGGSGPELTVGIPHESMDLVIMNPPFARSTGHEASKIGVPAPAFAGFGNSRFEQRTMSSRLKRINARLRKTRNELTGGRAGEAGHGNAGLASNFIDLAHEKLVPGGVLAMVLPMTFVQGDSWSKSRNLLNELYRDVTVLAIANHGATDRAFSADTGQADVIVVATRKDRAHEKDESLPLFVNLNRRPRTLLEAMTNGGRMDSLPRNGRPGQLRMTDDPQEIVFGSYTSGSFQSMGGASGVRSIAAIAPVMKALVNDHRLDFPRLPSSRDVPVTDLEELGSRGVHVLDISGHAPTTGSKPRGPFSHAKLECGSAPPLYPMLWAHDAKKETRLVVEPDQHGIVREGCDEAATGLWNKVSSRLHLNYDFQLNSQPLAACLTEVPTIGGRAWPNYKLDRPEWEIPVVLWANSTLGLISFWWIATRQHSGRVELPVSQHGRLTVLDPRKLSDAQLGRAIESFRSLAGCDLLPASEAYRDPTRKKLDSALLIEVLELDPEIMREIDFLRRNWCHEPSVHGGKPSRPQVVDLASQSAGQPNL